MNSDKESTAFEKRIIILIASQDKEVGCSPEHWVREHCKALWNSIVSSLCV